MTTTSDAAAPFEGLLNNPLYAAFEKPITAGGFRAARRARSASAQTPGRTQVQEVVG
jgi:hypothetical protein